MVREAGEEVVGGGGRREVGEGENLKVPSAS